MITLSDGAGRATPPSAPRRRRAKRRRTTALVAVLVIVVIAAAVVIAFAVSGGSGDSNPSPSTAAGGSSSVPSGGRSLQAANTTFTVGPTRPDLIRTVGPMTVTKAGTVLADVHVTGQLSINADNVTVRNFVAGNIVQKPGTKGMVLEDGTVDSIGAAGGAEAAVVWSDYTARNLEISRSFDGMKANGNVTIENCWIHDLNAQNGSTANGAGGYTHNDGIQASGGAHVVIRDNRIERPGNNSAVFVDSDQGRITDVKITGNYLDGGGYTLYVVQSRSAPQWGSPTNVTVEGNVFGKNSTQGPVTLAPGVTFTDNVDTANKPIPSHLDPLSK